MSKIAAEALIERLADWGVDTIFGIPGDGINGLMEGLRRHEDKGPLRPRAPRGGGRLHGDGVRQVDRAHRVCLATSGPGAIHLLNGLYDAKLDHVPVLAITGMQETQMLGTGYQQEVSLERLFMDVAEYNEMILCRCSCRPRRPRRASRAQPAWRRPPDDPDRHTGGRSRRQPWSAAGARRR